MNIVLSRRGLLTAGAGALLLPPVSSSSSSSLYPLSALERSYDGRIGAFALDTATGRVAAYRSRERFPLLSTFKLLAASKILRLARHAEPGLLDRVVHWTQADVLPSSPITAQHVADGMTVADLCAAAIEYSDNTAGNMLLRQIGGPPAVTRFARSLGDPVTRLDRWETALNDWTPGNPRDTTTPAAMGTDVRLLTTGAALHPDDRTRLIGWMRQTVTGGARIRAGLPPDWVIGDKTGSTTAHGGANDIAVAWPPGATKPLVIAIYTNRTAADGVFDNAVLARTATLLAVALGKL